jgi:hypothetical protein
MTRQLTYVPISSISPPPPPPGFSTLKRESFHHADPRSLLASPFTVSYDPSFGFPPGQLPHILLLRFFLVSLIHLFCRCVQPIPVLWSHSFVHSFYSLSSSDRPISSSKASSRHSAIKCFLFSFPYPLFSLRSSSSCLSLLPPLPVTTILPYIFPSVTCFRSVLEASFYTKCDQYS